MLEGFPPVVGRAPRVLILGSMPGPESLRRRRYYANGTNQFWRLVAGALGLPDPGAYERRLRMLTGNGIALWDVIRRCEREGALDSSIRRPAANDIAGFLRRHPGVRSVFANGGKARSCLKRFFPEIEARRLPSSSAAFAAMSFAEKLRRWRPIARG